MTTSFQSLVPPPRRLISQRQINLRSLLFLKHGGAAIWFDDCLEIPAFGTLKSLMCHIKILSNLQDYQIYLFLTAFGKENEGGVQVPRRLRIMRAQNLLEVDRKLQRGKKKDNIARFSLSPSNLTPISPNTATWHFSFRVAALTESGLVYPEFFKNSLPFIRLCR